MNSQLQKHYEVRARQPHRWHDQARCFICAANRLADWYVSALYSDAPRNLDRGYASFQPIMHLFGVAAENLLKALLVAQGKNPLSGGKLDRTWKNHNLNSFANRAGVRLTTSECELLQRLRDFIESSKYPIGKSAQDGHGGNRFEDPADLEQTWALLQKLDEAVRNAGPPALEAVDVKTLCRS